MQTSKTRPQEAEETRLIQSAYRKLLRSINVPLTKEEKTQIRQAYEMAVEAHQAQYRKTGEPYILHPIEVARICAEEMGLGTRAVVAALLHDVVEDSQISLKEINAQFGPKIALIVDGLTKFTKAIQKEQDDPELEMLSPDSHQAENFKKVLLTLAKDVRVVLIKMADRLHNMRTIGSMPRDKQLKIVAESTYIYAPLAHRLGLYGVKTEMEDLALSVTDPLAYRYVVEKLEETERDRNAYVRKFIAPIKARFSEYGLEGEIFGRVKSITSIASKVKAKQIPFEEIYDIFAVRVVLNVPQDKEKSSCWQVYSIISDIYVPVPERLKDWVSLPKPNGYESLHTTVMGPQGRFVEVQIRTKRMDEIAERGVAAHWKYKGVGEDSLFERWLSRAREVLENPSPDAIDFLNDFKADLFAEEVYVFTPKGEMRYFPKGSTALDFAFDIHTQVGYHCKSVKVNGRGVQMSQTLQNGDQVEIITHPGQKPTESWLRMVVTGRARSKIRQALREEMRRMGEFGKETLERKLRHLKLAFEENVDAVVKFFGYNSRLELYLAVYHEQVNFSELKNFRQEATRSNGQGHTTEPLELRAEPVARSPRTFKGQPRLLINGDDASTLTYSLATCCNPVLGDEVFAYVGKNGLRIHRTTCPNAEHLQATFGNRVMRAEWVDSFDASFVAKIRITGIDDLGVVRRLTDTIANQLRINMRRIEMDGDEGYFEGTITVVINNRDQLNLLIKTLKDIEGVNSVARVD
jgi:guanosine-3',5'-bis(diphosphate) 3'-pyrophosphohydrolase